MTTTTKRSAKPKVSKPKVDDDGYMTISVRIVKPDIPPDYADKTSAELITMATAEAQIILGIERGGYKTACYWRLGKLILATRFAFAIQNLVWDEEADWCRINRVSDPKKSRALAISRHFETDKAASEYSVNAAMAIISPPVAKPKPEPEPIEAQVKAEIHVLQQAITDGLKLVMSPACPDELAEKVGKKLGSLQKQVITLLRSIDAIVEVELVQVDADEAAPTE
jgi:hypothetical protein